MFTKVYIATAKVRCLKLLPKSDFYELPVQTQSVPEVVCANHAGMKVLGISCMTNMAAGILDKPLTHIEVMETGKKVEKEFSTFMKEIIKSI